MLREVSVRNFALIDELNIEFGGGLNVLTGETGAGKSIIIDAMSLLLGGRAFPDQIRSGSDFAVVDGAFEIDGNPVLEERLQEAGIDLEDDRMLILSREITKSGKNRCRVNGRTMPLGVFTDLGEYLVDIHGQHEHQSLLKSQRHLDLLDAFGGEAVWSLREGVSRIYREMRALSKELESLNLNERERAQRMDLLRFQVAEIDQARLKPGEDKELAGEKIILANAEKLYELAAKSYSLLYGGEGERSSVMDNLALAAADLESITTIDKGLLELTGKVKTLTSEIQEVSRQVRSYRDSIEFDPGRLAEVDDRLSAITRLKRKYGDTIEDMLNYRDNIAGELEAITSSEDRIKELGEKLGNLRVLLGSKCEELSNKRKAIASLLETKVMAELAELNMPGAVFKVRIDYREADDDGVPVAEKALQVSSVGVDLVEFLLSANPGEEPKPLARVASGGEVSRIMLAFKSALANADEVPTLIFDEIDAGIGGRTAQAIANKLSALGRVRQVICVTHLAQIASIADVHYSIVKEAEEGRTRTNVFCLDPQARIREIARMIGGADLTEITVKHAEEMLNSARFISAAGKTQP